LRCFQFFNVSFVELPAAKTTFQEMYTTVAIIGVLFIRGFFWIWHYFSCRLCSLATSDAIPL